MNIMKISTREDVANFILDISKPYNVIILERVGKLRLLKKLPLFIQGLIFTIVISIVGLPWIIIGILNGPNQPFVYILGYIAVANALYSSLMGTYILYNRAGARLKEIVKYLNVKLPPMDLQKWDDIFSKKKQLLTGFAVALFGALLVGFTAITFDKANPISVISATFGGFIMGLIIGSGIHFFVFFSSTAARFYLTNISKVYKLAPVETSGVTYLFSITLDFMLIGSSVGTFALFTLIIYLLNASPYQLKFTYIPAIVAAIFIVLVAMIMLFRSIIIFTNHFRGEKLRVLSELQDLINDKVDKLDNNNQKSEIYEEIEKVISIYNRVKSSSTWPFEAKVVRNTLASFLVPFIPALVEFAFNKIFS